MCAQKSFNHGKKKLPFQAPSSATEQPRRRTEIMVNGNQGSWKSRWREQWLDAMRTLKLQHELAESLANQMEDLLGAMEAQMALVRLYARLAETEEDEPP